MFRRNNTDSKNNGQPADEKVREEDRAEQEIRQKVGNQAAGNMPPQIPPNIGNEALNGLISGSGNPGQVQNVIRKGLDISDEINPNDILKLNNIIKKDRSNNGGKDIHNIDNLNNIDNENNIENLNNIDNENSAFNIVNNNDFPQANGGIFDVLDRIIEEKNRLLQGEKEDKKEIDQPKQVNIINENNLHDNAESDDEIDFDDYLDPSRIRELRKRPDYRSRLREPVKKVDLNISNSNIEDVLNGIDGDEDKKEPVRKDGKKQQKKKAPQEEVGYGDTYALEEDMVPAPRSKKIGKSWRNKKQSKKAPVLSKNVIGNLQGIEDEYWKSGARERTLKHHMKEIPNGNDPNAINEEMEKIKNWNFRAQKMDDIKVPSKFRRFLSYFARGAGNLLGLALQVITLGHFWRAKSKVRSWFKDEDSWQQEKDHRAIPGWNGAKFDSNATSGEDILADFRRVPTVWSHLTAAKAAETVEEDGEKVEKPLDPVVSVLVDQPVSGTTQTMEGKEMGHVMLGIEYSRKSIVSNRYERYKLQYGFYPAKDMLSKLSTVSTGLKDSAVVPGLLVDDYGHSYDVSRRYPAKTAQVNAIIQASEKYAEGGYSVFDRNCATFVKEMVVNTAHLATGGDIFRKSEVTFSHLANLGITGSAAFDQNIKAGTETALMDLSGEDAETYEKYGNRKVTKRDWTNYKKSMGKGSTWKKETYVPAEIAEHMRRMEGEGTGEIGTKKYADPLKDNAGNTILGLDRIKTSINSTADSFLSNHAELFSPEEQQKMPYELLKIYSDLGVSGQPLGDLEEKIKENLDKENENKPDDKKLDRTKINEQYYVTPQDLRDAREKLSENVSKVHIFLNYYLKNDKRVHHELMNLISLLNYGIEYVDDLYVKSVRAGKLENNNLTDVRDALTLEKYTVKAGPEQNAEEAEFSPTHYESYIQIYKDPKTAVERYNRLRVLREKKKQRGKWTESMFKTQVHRIQSTFNAEDREDLTYDEAVELAKLERLEELALQFDNAHNYMLEKEQYSQQDIDYAFRMNYMEKNGTEKKAPTIKSPNKEDFRDKYRSASGIYITLILDKIFYGLKEKVLNEPDQGGLSMETVQNYQTLNKWLDGFLTDRVKPKKKEFRMILRGLYRAMKAGEPGKVTSEKMRERLSDIFTKILVNRNFKSMGASEKELFANMNLSNYTYTLGKNNEYEFSKLLNHMIKECLNEDRKKPLEIMVFDD